ncbi:MAG TPA: SDR family NAD(P)-dependent oxidoreductase, partial [Polyangium sp.]|nr:SDR family NAD(P)-dependent oxidoreductase [Polyangium sp.]
MANEYRILITGASSGFGKLTAESLAREGHRVFAGMRDPEGRNAGSRAELMAKGGSLEVVDLDVTNDASVEKAVAWVEQQAGGLDVVINNAGIAGMGLTESFTPEQARAMFEVNVVGVQRVNRAALPLMRRQGKNGPWF